ncbi:DoxX family protein [Vibrio mexicanus]|uniref:DoxX family protein n=1 Tax=Vibrio mexicanus TaxID=1004326 RepID=UPI00063C01B0|nr:DoxX family protein [Vibrio mexicanus]
MSHLTPILTVILILFFTFASSIKLLGWQKYIFDTQLAFFEKYGLNRRMMGLVGVIELSASLLLILALSGSNFNLAKEMGASLILVTSIGAIFFHLRFDTWRDAVPAIVTGIMSGLVLIQSLVLLW